MKQFALITVGFTTPTEKIMQSWTEWFKSIENRIVNQIGFTSGREVTLNGVRDLPMDKDALTGHLVIKAENMDEAIKIAQECPMISSTKVYEVMAHGTRDC